MRVTESDAPGGPRTGSVPGSLRVLLSQPLQKLLRKRRQGGGGGDDDDGFGGFGGFGDDGADGAGGANAPGGLSGGSDLTAFTAGGSRTLHACFQDFRLAVHAHAERAQVRWLRRAASARAHGIFSCGFCFGRVSE